MFASYRVARTSAAWICALALVTLLVPAVSAEVPRTENGAEPAQGVVTLQMEELWRAGGEDDEEVIFGIVARALADDDNNIYLLDSQLAEIPVFSSDGEWLETLGREGDGPGEFRGPSDMCFLPDGTIGVVQAFPGKVVKLGLDNSPAGTWTLGDPAAGGFYMMRALRSGGGNVVAGGTQQSVDQAAGIVTRESFIASLAEDGTRLANYTTDEVVIKFAELRLDEMELIDSADRRYDVGPDGRVVAAIPRYGYEVSIFAPDGTLERVFTRDYESWTRDERAAGIWQRILESIRDTQAPNAPISWEDKEPDVEFLRVAGDGSIWVLTSRAMWDPPEGIFTQYDVFSPEGQFEKQIQFVCEGDPRDDFLFFAGDDLAFVVTGFWDAALSRFGGAGAADDEEEAEPMSVICYQIKGES